MHISTLAPWEFSVSSERSPKVKASAELRARMPNRVSYTFFKTNQKYLFIVMGNEYVFTP